MAQQRTPWTSPPSPGAPSDWIVRHASGISPVGTVLDVACGAGRHLRWLHARGLAVTGIDRTLDGVSGLRGAPGVSLIEADLEDGTPFPLRGQRFSGVVVTNYLHRPLLPALVAATADDGVFLYETFALGQERLGRPTNPDFLLRPNELVDAVRPSLTVVSYEHGLVDDGRPRIVQRIAACGSRHVWATTGRG